MLMPLRTETAGVTSSIKEWKEHINFFNFSSSTYISYFDHHVLALPWHFLSFQETACAYCVKTLASTPVVSDNRLFDDL